MDYPNKDRYTLVVILNEKLHTAGAVLYLTEFDQTIPREIWTYSESIDAWPYSKSIDAGNTDNYAEYMGLIIGLAEARRKCLPNLTVKGVSLQVLEQIQGAEQVNDPRLQPLYERACLFVQRIGQVKFELK